jgi:hypothetical protein
MSTADRPTEGTNVAEDAEDVVADGAAWDGKGVDDVEDAASDAELAELGFETADEAVELRIALTLVQQLAPGGELVGVGAQAVQGFQAPLDLAALLHDLGVFRRVVPEPGFLHLVVDLGQLALEVVSLKDTPGGF